MIYLHSAAKITPDASMLARLLQEIVKEIH